MTIDDPFQTLNAETTVLPGGASPAQPLDLPQPVHSESKRAFSRRPAQAVTPYTAEPTLGPGSTTNNAKHPPGHSPPSAGRYDRVAELGRGGWGVVDRVLDRQLEREVAIKRIGGEGRTGSGELDPEIRKRFLHEAKITSQLQHPGVVPVHELTAAENGEVFYVMKLLEGDNLGQLIRAQHTPAKTPHHRWTTHALNTAIAPLLDRYIDVCQAIAYAHQQGVLHRDLKPANVMVGGFGETIVVDWGLAKRIDDSWSASPTQVRSLESIGADVDDALQLCNPSSRDGSASEQHTMQGTIVGTPAYMSPEQARGEIERLSPQSDIYSLGVMLYEMVAGRHPYRGLDVHQVLAQVKSGTWPPLRSVQPAAPRSLAAICDAAMAFDPASRYTSAAALADDVRRYLAGDAVSVCVEPLMDRVLRLCRRYQASCITAAASAMILLVASSVFGLVLHHAHQHEKASRVEAELAHENSLRSLTDARDSADVWLTDLSGSLQFYPGLDCIRDEFLCSAIHQYERILCELRQESNDSTVARAKRGSTVPSTHFLLASLEEAKCCDRLGDLYRLTDKLDESKHRYDEAERILCQLDQSLSSQKVDEELVDDVELQKINTAIGRRLLLASLNASNAVTDPGWDDESRQHGSWLLSKLPADPTRGSVAGSSLNDVQAEAATALVRLQLVDHGAGDQGHAGSEEVGRLTQAVQWASWLVQARGEARDRNLWETAQRQLANYYETSRNHDLAQSSWLQLVDKLKDWNRATAVRPDRLQSLAHARLKTAQSLTVDGRHLEAAELYRAAIDDLNLAWQLLDTDAFHQSSLAAAQYSLGELSARSTEHAPEAEQLLSRSIANYRDLMDRSASPQLLQRLCDAHALLASLLNDADPVTSLKHYEHAASGYQTLLDHPDAADTDLSLVQDQLVQLRGAIEMLKARLEGRT